MNEEKIKILAIETSCDETAAAVIGKGDNGCPMILSNVISSQVDLHAKTGGVVPEVASRAHMEAIVPVVAEALIQALKTPSPVISSEVEKSLANKKISPCASLGRDDNKCENNLTIEQSNNYQEAIKLLDQVTHLAVTAGPGLIGSLLVGFSAAKTLAYAKELPIIPINHIEGHLYSALGGIEKITFPVLALTASGGHTLLVLMRDHGDYKIVGETLDDAVGEAYDKVAKLLDLGYPGGPIISKLAAQYRQKVSSNVIPAKAEIQRTKSLDSTSQASGWNDKNSSSVVFPRPILNDGTFNFSFSGLKTAVLVWVKKYLAECGLSSVSDLSMEIKEEIAFAFEEAVADVLAEKTKKATAQYKPKAVVFAGGVSANEYLRERLSSELSTLNSKPTLLVPPKELTGDNAAMIGIAAYNHILRGDIKSWDQISIDSNLEL